MMRYVCYGFMLMLCSTSAHAYDVIVKADPDNVGLADIATSVEYSITDGDCKISWISIQRKSSAKSELKVTQQCPRSFREQADYHEDILARINKDRPLAGFSVLSWGGFSYQDDFSWVIPIALASDTSRTYHDYRQNYPHAKVNNINQIFVELANTTHAYQPLAELFKDYELELQLTAVEKVFSSRADKLPFYDDLREQSVGRHAHVIYDAGMSYFQISPQKK